MDWLLQVAKDYGLFVALVAYILWYFDRLIEKMRKENSEREAKYQAIIQTLTDDVKERLAKIEAFIRRKP